MSKANEIQIELDDVYACPGHCPGCVLTTEERKMGEPDMPPAVRKKILQELEAYIPTLSGLEKMNLTYGIADHLLMSTEYLIEIYRAAVELFKKTNLDGSGHIFMSTSLIGKTEIIESKLLALWLASKDEKTKISPLVVLDPAKLLHHSFGQNYSNNIAYTKKLFGVVDLAINLSEAAVSQMAPDVLIKFAKENGFREVTVNWTPTPDNIESTYSQEFMVKLIAWLQVFSKLSKEKHLECSYVPVMEKAFSAWRCASDESMLVSGAVMDTANKIIPETLKKSLQFDHTGRVFPKWEAIGDVPHNERFALKDWGSVMDGSLSVMVERGVGKSIGTVLKTISSGACLDCKYAGICATTGFHIYTHVIKVTKGQSKKCPHVAFALFKQIEMESERHE